MRIGIAGPMTLDLLRPYLPESINLPRGYPFPMTAMLVRELLQRGHEVTAYTTSTDITEPCIVSSPVLTLCVMPSPPRHRGKNLFRDDIEALSHALQAHPCDVVHAHWTYEFAVAALNSGIPPLVTVHDRATAVLLQFKDGYRLARWVLNAYAVRKAPYLSAVSPYIWSALPHAAKKKATVIPNFISDSVARGANTRDARQAYLISVCNGFSPLKNLGNALLGFRQAQSNLPGVRYVLVGQDCEPGGRAYRFCQEHGCLDNVVFAGPLSYDQVLERVSLAGILLHPSYEESFGMSVLEAMSLGTPVIAGAHSGNMPNLIEHGRSGYLCDVSSPAAIRDALCSLWADDSLRGQIGQAARETARRTYSASVVVSQYLSAYERVLAGRPLTDEACLCN